MQETTTPISRGKWHFNTIRSSLRFWSCILFQSKSVLYFSDNYESGFMSINIFVVVFLSFIFLFFFFSLSENNLDGTVINQKKALSSQLLSAMIQADIPSSPKNCLWSFLDSYPQLHCFKTWAWICVIRYFILQMHGKTKRLMR